jgi:hypothetical protein
MIFENIIKNDNNDNSKNYSLNNSILELEKRK